MLISPAKMLDFVTETHVEIASEPLFPNQANRLVDELRNYSIDDLMKLMKTSQKLAESNRERFYAWNNNAKKSDSKQALLAFVGEVFRGIQAEKMNDDDYRFAQNHLRILSGLYGVLRPMDMIQPYRLEMGARLKVDDFQSIYQFWGNRIRKQIEADNLDDNTIINLASNVYFRAVQSKQMNALIITPVFKDLNKGQLKVITMYAKKARGHMVNFIVKNRIKNPEQIKTFNVNGYEYLDDMSDDKKWVFVRG